MSSIVDPKGYYRTLGLTPGADLPAVKSAYRARAKAVHPDRDISARAKEEFQRLVEAYSVLKDDALRAEYDSATGVIPRLSKPEPKPKPEPDNENELKPYCCSACDKLTAQPRYVVYHTVRSYLVWARRGHVAGIFCRDCADRAAVKASTATWAAGWWSPLGLLLTPLALLRNLLGGSMPGQENARILIRQARAFLARGNEELARSLAVQAARFARDRVQRRQVVELLEQTAGVPANRRLKERWRQGGGVFLAQLMPLVALPAMLGMFALIAFEPWEQPVAASAGILVKQAAVGEIRHVAVDDLKVRLAASDGSPVTTLLDRFETVEVIGGAEDPEYVQVRTAAGVTGFVQTRALYAGSGSRFKKEWCAENRGAPPTAGEVLVRRASGESRLLVHNDGRRDGMVKLKTLGGNTVMAFYVPATYHIGITGIPEGTYRIEFASGRGYSRACGIFVEEMQAGLLPVTLTFKYISNQKLRALSRIPEISLAPPPGDAIQPQPLDVDRFAADD